MTWDEHANGWDEKEAVRLYSRSAFERLVTVCQERAVQLQGARVCDFGCGTGLLTEQLSPRCHDIVAVDTSTKMVEVLNEKVKRLGLPNVRTATEPMLDMVANGDPLLSSGFDAVVCSSVCAFLDDYPGTVRALAGLLKPGGMFIQWDWELDPASDEPFGLSRAQVAEALSGAGLESVQIETAFEVEAEGETMRPLMGVGQVPGAT